MNIVLSEGIDYSEKSNSKNYMKFSKIKNVAYTMREERLQRGHCSGNTRGEVPIRDEGGGQQYVWDKDVWYFY